MNPSDEERRLTEEYRRASADEAARPSAAVRKAILAEAAAAASQRKPAANDSRYLWRGVAGVAVLGFAILLWKQADHRLPGEAPLITQSAPPEEVLLEAAPPAAPVSAPATQPATDLQARAPRVPAAPPRAAESEVANAAQMAPAAAAAVAPAPAPAPEQLRNESARAFGKMSAAQDAEVDATALLRIHFPQQYQSDTPHSLWLVQDSAGAVLRSGEMTAGQTFGEIRPAIEQDLGGRPLRPWRIRSLQNARGQTIELGIAQTP